MKQPDALSSAHLRNEVIPKTTEVRCHCGHLVAKLREEGVELKCRRCKRIVILPFSSNGQDELLLEPCHSS